MGKTLNFFKFFLIAFILVLFSCCTRTAALRSSIDSNSDIELTTASAAPNMALSATEPEPTYFAAEQPAIKKVKPSLIKSVKAVYQLKKAIKSSSVIPKSENYKAPKKHNYNIAAISFGVLLVLIGLAGLIFTLFSYSFTTLISGTISFPISVLIAVLSGFCIIGGIMLFVEGLKY